MDRSNAAEQSRLELLKSLEILDTPPEEVFDRLTQLAARICETPMAAITLIDERRQWFKSTFGWQPTEIPRDISFCLHTVDAKRPFVVHDASKDQRFKMNPFVTGTPGLRFYAGVPLVSTGGAVLGTLSVLDRVPRTLTETQVETLEMLAEQVVMHFALRRQRKELERVAAERDRSNAALVRQADHLKEAQRIAQIGSWEIDAETGNVAWSDEIFRIFGIPYDLFPRTYKGAVYLVHEEDRPRVLAAVESALVGKQSLDEEHRIVRPDGELRYVHVKGELKEDDEGRRILAGTAQDFTARRRAQEQMNLLGTCIERLNDALIITEATQSDESGPRIIFVNAAFENQTGYRREEILGKSPHLLLGPATQQAEFDRICAAVGDRVPVSVELITYRKNGEPFWSEVDITPVIGSEGRVTNFVAVQRDITERKQRLEELAKTNRALQMLTRCNEALLKAESEQKLLEEISRIAVDVGGYYIAWVGYAEDDAVRTIKPVAHAGPWGEFGEITGLKVSWSADVPEGGGPAGQAIRTGMPVVCDDVSKDACLSPWLASAQRHGYKSVLGLPLRSTNRTFGVLILLSAEARRVPESELNLLQELADNLAFGINHIRSQETRRRIEQAVLRVAAAVSASSGMEFFERLACNMGVTLGAQAAFVARLLPERPRAIQTLGAAKGEDVIENFHFVIEGTPWARCAQDAECVLQRRAAESFPLPDGLADVGAQTCVGRRLDNSSAQPVGVLCVLFREPVRDLDFILSTLQIFAARAAGELERQHADERIHMQASLLDKARDAIMVCEVGGRIQYWNKSAERIFGWTAGEALGRQKQDLVIDDTEIYKQAVNIVLKNGDWIGEIKKRRKDGSTLMVEGHWTLVTNDGERPDSILAIDTDITQRKAAEREIERLAFFDPLTGLPNRRLLMDRLEHALASAHRTRHTGALLFIDLDNFKSLNDTLGHDKGDELLVQVARRIETCVPRKSDTVARLGGDEFVVMLEDLSEHQHDAAAQAELVGEKILAVFTQPFQLGGLEQHSTPSIGVTLFDRNVKDVDELLKRADLAMYQAKAAGRNTIRFFDPDMQTVVTARVALESDLRQSLQQQDFYLQYQRQANGEGRTIGAEALVRWQHPRRGLVSPALFIPLAEETGMIMQLGQWVLETACRQLAAWAAKAETAKLTVAVNVSSREFRHPEFVKNVLDVLERTGADAKRLKLELTESLLVENVEATVTKMTALKEHGVCFSLDDFGTGYSSLSYLKRLPLDQLKIDRSFVRDVLIDSNVAAIARTIVALGQTLGLEVIAEGVETKDQRDFLARNGCHAYQGYLYSPPLTAEQFVMV